MTLEKDFQSKFLAKLRKLGCKCYKQQMNATTRAGTPDVIVLLGPVWIMLEFKKAKNSPKRPGQQKNIDWANEVSFGWFVYPENADEVYEQIKRLV